MPSRGLLIYARVIKKLDLNARCIFGSGVIQQNHYEILEVAKDASLEEVKKAFIAKSKLYHPDKNSGDQEMSDKFIKITEAYRVLSDPEQRVLYNHHLNKRPVPGSARIIHRSSDYQSPYQKVKDFTTDWSDYYSTYGGGKAERDMKKDADEQFWKEYMEYTKKYGGGEIHDGMSSPPKNTVGIEMMTISSILIVIYLIAFLHSSTSGDKSMDHDSFDSEHMTWLMQLKNRKS